MKPHLFQRKITAVDFESALPPDNRRVINGRTDATFVAYDLPQA